MDAAQSQVVLPSVAPAVSPAKLLRTGLLYAGVPAGLIAIWQLSSSTGALPSFLLPSPLQVVQGLIEITLDGTLSADLSVSIMRSLTGFAIATVIAIPVGVAIGWFKSVRKASYFTLLLLMPIPITAWISLAILWFGIGDKSAIFLVALAAAVPILVNTIHGVEWVDKLYIEAALTLGTGPRAILWRIVVPAALPNIVTGLRLGLRNSWAGLVVAEMIGARSGVGYLIWDSRLMMRSDLLIVGMLLVGILGSVSDYMMSFASRRMLRGHGGQGRDD
jgi:ABC-type nitrate/sulfonate/bicarbonate transport system permease component